DYPKALAALPSIASGSLSGEHKNSTVGREIILVPIVRRVKVGSGKSVLLGVGGLKDPATIIEVLRNLGGVIIDFGNLGFWQSKPDLKPRAALQKARESR